LRSKKAVPLLLCAVLTAQVLAEDFYLESVKTGKRFGPFTFADGAVLSIGAVELRVVKEKPAQPAKTPEQSAAEGAAAEAALAWLRLLDAGEYEQGWAQIGGYMKRTIEKAQFLDSVRKLRETLGEMVSRKLLSAQFTTSLPSAPDGQYVILQFATERARKKNGVETVVPMLDSDGVWRVSGYNVR
jgi:hypothetical protein